MRRLFITILLCSLIVFASCKSSPMVTETAVTSEELQEQIAMLSNMLYAYTGVLSQLKSKLTDVETVTDSQDYEQILSDIISVTSSIKKLNTTLSSLEEQVESLQRGLQAATTTIGNEPVYINGLSVLFITNNIEIGATGSTTPNAVQFSIKIINTTKSTVTNIDITGKITSPCGISGAMAAGYPQIVDGAGLCSYAFTSNGMVIYLEAYSAKTTLSIPPGGSITLRPRLTILAAKDHTFPAMSLGISLTSLTYDITTTR